MRFLRSIRRGRLLLLAAIALGAAGAFAINAFAVHDLAFQLDGDVSASTTTSVGGGTQNTDWDSIFDAAGAKRSSLPSGFTAAGFDRDFNTSAGGTFLTTDSTTYTTGSKDTLPINPGWQCASSNNVNSKVDIMNAYATAYTAAGGDQVVYFALERNTNTGDGNVAFWFLQSDVGCTSTGSATTFSGQHMDGDLLIVSAFTNGGSVSNVSVYRWNGGANGTLGSVPVAQGADCRTTSGNDTACATANNSSNGTGGTITTPWLTANAKDGAGHSLRTSEFFEGGLDLTKANLGGKCFNVFIGDTRSSQSLTATLFDYARGKIGECTSSTVTTPQDGSGNAIPAGGLTLPADPADASVSVQDSAAITVSGVPSFTGTVSYSLCGPTATTSTATCDSGGVSIGSPQSVTTSGTVTSPTATVTEAGRYCWRADFSGDSSIGVPSSSDHSSSECFVVNPRKATLSTNAGAGPVDFGNAVTDTATLGNTVHEQGTGGPSGSDGSINPATLGGDAQGTITFTLYKDDSCTAKATGTGSNPQTVSVSGNGTYGPVSFTPDAPGTYYWVANYNGDSPNTLAADQSACNDSNESVTVRQIPTGIKTKQSWYPQDTAEVSATTGNLASGGNVSFSLYDNATCTGTAKYAETVGITGGHATETVSTSNSTFAVTTLFGDPAGSTAGPYSWKVVYTPAAADTAHLGTRSSCDAEHFSITYTNDPGPNTP